MGDLSIEASVELTGKITDSNLWPEIQAALNDGLMELSQIEGANRVKARLTKPGRGRVSGNLRDHIGSGQKENLVYQFDAGALRYGRNLIYSYWVEGVSSRNPKTSFAGHRMFGITYERLLANKSAWRKYIGNAVMKVFGE